MAATRFVVCVRENLFAVDETCDCLVVHQELKRTRIPSPLFLVDVFAGVERFLGFLRGLVIPRVFVGERAVG